ncbi:MAG: disulfide bond formation protein DsbA [Microbacterium sp.]|uniref:DsbA family protein n=1 Tax=Microbacterium sp. TaxID=51671 RepID=UPI000C418808|nr:disulfide bond formation protein DsbA [Microbacterium sp.]HAM12240.1 disulfide bond formation protein DsbA [Microbacterium sp.]HAS32881.1 disulfide bond formation protein DsbA [Microbacterium sp.]HBR87921.1 disulfide bond formation protein DsbA [Microbacterium sp.]
MIAAAAVLVALVLDGLIYILIDRAQAPDPATASVIRSDSHVLDDGGTDAVTIVEFLDFECEACGAYYPVVEELRDKYAGRITYAVRYFPLPGHFNSTHAAVAAEAAAQQGRFEDMYHRLFETQAEWGEAQESRAALFRDYAAQLGLDLAAYDAAVADPATQDRVSSDFEEGRALGISSTPTFFVDGKPLTIERWDDLETAIEAALRD